MKTTVKIIAVCLLAVSACQNTSSLKQDFITGTYVQSGQSKYGVADDTLVIIQADGNHYLIDFEVTYQAIRDGKLLPKHRKKDTLSAVWDAGKEQLQETKSGRTYTFEPDKKIMRLNDGIFQKIK